MESMDPDTGLLAIIAALRASVAEYTDNPRADQYMRK